MGTLNLINEAIARWPKVDHLGSLAFFEITVLFIVALGV